MYSYLPWTLLLFCVVSLACMERDPCRTSLGWGQTQRYTFIFTALCGRKFPSPRLRTLCMRQEFSSLLPLLGSPLNHHPLYHPKNKKCSCYFCVSRTHTCSSCPHTLPQQLLLKMPSLWTQIDLGLNLECMGPDSLWITKFWTSLVAQWLRAHLPM